MRPSITTFAVAAIVSSTMAYAQFPTTPGAAQPGPPRMQMPPRDNTAPQTGTARIRGRVVAADTGNPLRRAQVRVTAGDIRVNRSATTDAEGRYELNDLPAGRYSMVVARNGYVTLQFGQQRPFEPGRPIELAAAQVLDRVDFALPRGSVIAGRVTDELGEPVAAVRMTALRHRYNPTGERQLTPANPGGMYNIVTNDLGEFRIFGLMPGTYVVSANPDDGGFVAFSGGVMPGAPGGDSTDGYTVTYYPGTVNAEEAQAITVGVSETASATFALSTARMSTISGVIRTSAGQPAATARVMLRDRGNFGGGFFRGQPPTGPDGRFSIPNVPPGEYILDVPGMGNMRPGGGERGETASIPITVAGRDITDLVITTTPGAVVSGRIVFEGTSTANRPNRVMLQPADPRTPMRMGPDDGMVDASGQFRIQGALGRVLLRAMFQGPASGPGVPWSLKSVSFNGLDITDTPIDISSIGDVNGIEITMTDKVTTLSGTVVNSLRAPAKDYVVVVFPDRLREGVSPQRFIRSIRPDQEGKYQTRALPPGDYLAVAVPSLEGGDEWDPAFRKRMEGAGKRFTLGEGQTATLELQLIQ